VESTAGMNVLRAAELVTKSTIRAIRAYELSTLHYA